MPRHIFKLLPDENGGWHCVKIEAVPEPETKIHIIDDTMAPLLHPCDEKFYTSKREFSAVTKAHGCVEVGERPGDRRERSINLATRRDALWNAFSRAYDDCSRREGSWTKQ